MNGTIKKAAIIIYILKFIRRYEKNRVIRIAGKITKDILNNEEFIGI